MDNNPNNNTGINIKFVIVKNNQNYSFFGGVTGFKNISRVYIFIFFCTYCYISKLILDTVDLLYSDRTVLLGPKMGLFIKNYNRRINHC